ncbi:MAG: tripartite tricarboxylate transporter substrate binding protein [Burkholderiales bacterium]
MIRFSAVRAKWSSGPRRARLVVLRAAAAAMLAATAFQAAAQDPYPSRPVKVLIPYAPGGATDIVARYLASEVNKVLGQQFIIENRPGASGNIALEAAAKAAPDGYTLFVGNVTTNAINESTFTKELHIKPSRDLVGITELAEIPHILAATPSFPATGVAEAIAYAKKNPGKINFASAGLGSYPQLDMMRLEKAAGVSMTHIPYKNGAAGMVPALITGEVDIAFINLSSTIEHVKIGKIKALATTAPSRLAELPNVPTMAEAGYAGIGTNAWQAIFAPAATPKPVIDKLFNAIVSVMSTPEMKDRLAKQLMTVALSKSPQDWTEHVREETKKWGDFIRENHITLD